MPPLSPRALLTIVQAIEYQRDHAIGQLERGEHHLPNWEKADLIEYTSDLESTLDEVEALYNDLRKRNRSMIPFTELIKNPRDQ